MRVATRRLRAALEMFGPASRASATGEALKQVKALADALGERRDRDVAIELPARVSLERGAGRRPGRARDPDRRAARGAAPRPTRSSRPFVAEERLTKLRGALGELVEAARR